MTDREIDKMLGRIEDQLIDDLIKELKRPASIKAIEAGDFESWKISQLKALSDYRKRNKKLYTKQSEEELMTKVSDALNRSYGEGADAVKKEALGAVQKGFNDIKSKRSRQALTVSFSGVNDRKLQSLIDTAAGNIKEADRNAVKYAESAYSKILFDAQAYYESGTGTLAKSIDMATKDLLSKGITCVEYKNGARTDPRTYSEMALRTADKQSYMQGEAKMREEIGMNTVIVTRRGNACPKCMQYVGKIFYDDVYGSGGKTDGKYPLLSSAIAGGLYHPNCRDVHTTYFEGITTERPAPTEAEKKEANRIYTLEQQQRYNERQIRKYDRLRRGTMDPENQQRYEALWQSWKTKNKDFVNSHSELKRKYDREKGFLVQGAVSTPPVIKTPPAPKKPAQKSIPKQEPAPKPKTTVVKTFEEAETALTDKLGFVKLEGMDHINTELLVDSTNQLVKLEEKFGAIGKSKTPVFKTANSGSAIAYVESSVTNPERQSLSLCRKYFDVDKADFIATQKHAIKSGWSMPVKDTIENYSIYTVTHEYGHLIQNILLQEEINKIGADVLRDKGNWNSPNPAQWTKGFKKAKDNLAKKIYNEIMEIAIKNNPGVNVYAQLSEYGRSNNYEFFAEVFANSQLGAPNALGNAMNDWLKQKGLLK